MFIEENYRCLNNAQPADVALSIMGKCCHVLGDHSHKACSVQQCSTD
jgi:hypothetical protein